MVSVCLSVTFVHCALTAEDIGTISSAYDSPMSLTHTHSVKIWLASVNPFIPKVTHPLLIWASKTVDGKLRPNGHGGEPVGNYHRFRKPPSLFRVVYHRWRPTTSPSLKMVIPEPLQATLPFAKLLWLLFMNVSYEYCCRRQSSAVSVYRSIAYYKTLFILVKNLEVRCDWCWKDGDFKLIQ